MNKATIGDFWSCPQCRANVPSQTTLCARCGYQYQSSYRPPPAQQQPFGQQQQAAPAPGTSQLPLPPKAPAPVLSDKEKKQQEKERKQQEKERKRKEKEARNTDELLYGKDEGSKMGHLLPAAVALGMILMFIGVTVMIVSIPTDSEPDRPVPAQQPDEPERSYRDLLDDEPVTTDFVTQANEPQTNDYLSQDIREAEPSTYDYNFDGDYYQLDDDQYNSELSEYTYGDTYNNSADANYSRHTFSDSATLSLVRDRTNLYNIPEPDPEASSDLTIYAYHELYEFLQDYKAWKTSKYDPAMDKYETALASWELNYERYENAHRSWQYQYDDEYETWQFKYKSWQEHEYKHWNEVVYPAWQQEYQEWQRDQETWEDENENEDRKTARKYQLGMIIHDLGAIIASTMLMLAGLAFRSEDISLRKSMIASGTVILVVMFALPLAFSYLLAF